jgi:tetratricopeptide (TPR) repeat protein
MPSKRTTAIKAPKEEEELNEERIQELEDEIEEAYDLQWRNSVETAVLWNDLGNRCRDASKLEQAHCYYHKALELSRKDDDDDDDFSSSSISNSDESETEGAFPGNLGLVASAMGTDEEARSCYVKALKSLHSEN